MRVLVTGGSGVLGVNLVRQLEADRDTEIVALDLQPFPASTRALTIRGDIRDRPTVERAMADADVVVHCAAALPSYPTPTVRSVDVDGTRVLLETAARRPVRRFVHISSTAVYGVPDQMPSREDDPPNPTDAYSLAKIEAEALCAEFRRRGMCVPVLRPKTFIGPERLGLFSLLFECAYEGRRFPVLGSGNVRYQFLHVLDLCQAIQLALTAPEAAANDVYNIAAAEYRTLREDFQAVLDEAGHGRRIVGLPAAPALALLRLLDACNASPLYGRLYRKLTSDSYVSIEKARRRLGYAPQHSNRSALLDAYRWYVANIAGRPAPVGRTHRHRWRMGALRLAKLAL